MRYIERLSFIFICLCLSACSSSLKISSQPEKVSVFVKNEESGEKTKLGETPLLKKDQELKDLIADIGMPGKFVRLSFEKEGFQSKDFWVQLSPAGNISTEMNIQLKRVEEKSNKEQLETAQEIVKKLFLAQKLARAKDFERALIEIDKVLEGYPEFSRALSMKASIYYARGDFKESLDWFEKSIDVDPELDHSIKMASMIRKQLKLPAVERPPKKRIGGGK